jgi:hypothetical protein
MAKAQADIANTAVRMLLQDIGAAYDEMRGLKPYGGTKDFEIVRQFFGNQCCYCGFEFVDGKGANQDHLIPINKSDLGLHAWGNVVPACQKCNSSKQGKDWRDFIVKRSSPEQAKGRYERVQSFIREYEYAPSFDLRSTTEELYAEIGGVARTLIDAKVNRLRAAM